MPRCYRLATPPARAGDLDITIDGRSAAAATPWSLFWRDTLFTFGAKPLNRPSDVPPFLKSTDLAAPSFLGISGQAVKAGTVTPQSVVDRILVADGTEISAFVGTTLCGSTKTKTLTSFTRGFGANLFGLIVPPESVKPGCGTPGAAVSFCVGEFQASQPAAGPFSFAAGPATPVIWEPGVTAGVTIEPTSERCPVLALGGMSLVLAMLFRRRLRNSSP